MTGASSASAESLPRLGGLLVALCVVAGGEALQVVGGGVSLVAALCAQASLLAVWLGVPLLGELLRVALGRLRSSRARLGAEAAVAVLQAGWAHRVLVEYAPFAGYVPFMAAAVLLGAGLLLLGAWRQPAGRSPAWSVALTLGGFAVAGVLGYFNYTRYAGAYPTLHHATLGATLCVLSRAAALWLVGLPGRVVELAVASLMAITTVASLVYAFSAAEAGVGSTVRARTITGQLQALAENQKVAAFTGQLESKCTARPAPLAEPVAAAELARLTGVAGEPGWGGRLNLLLVTIEALRADDAGLSAPNSSMPRLGALAADGGFVFERAYSPSSTTIQTMAALQQLTAASQAALSLEANREWRGHLRDEAPTFLEALQQDGYATWAAVHAGTWGSQWTAPARGIQELRRGTGVEDPNADAEIVDMARELVGAHTTGTPWFGWVFLLSPHDPYVPRDGLTEQDPARARYQGELRYVDAQLGRLLDRLAETGQLERTVIMVTGDHGEAFGEHGTAFHSGHVYEEAVRVPLVLRWPGVPGTRFAAPVISTEVLAALLMAGPVQTAALARRAAREYLVPTRRAAGGAAVTELVSMTQMWLGLVGERHKLVSHLSSKTVHLFDLQADPGEQHDLFGHDPELTRHWRARLDAVLAWRACAARYRLQLPPAK